MTTVTSALSARAVRLGAPREVAVRPARVAARAAAKRDADPPARKPSVAKGASVKLASAALGGIPVSLATALPALADDGGGGGGGAFGIVALIAVAGAAFVAGQGSGGGGGGGGDDDANDPPPPTGSQDSKNYAKNLTIASDVKRKGRKPPKPKGL